MSLQWGLSIMFPALSQMSQIPDEKCRKCQSFLIFHDLAQSLPGRQNQESPLQNACCTKAKKMGAAC